MSRSVQRFVDVSGLRKVAQGFEWVGKAAMGVLRTMVEIVPVLATITGAATLAGLAKLVSSYADWSHQLTATADGIGMTTQQLQQFEDATRLAGGNTADMDEALKGLYKTATDFMTGKASGDTVGWLNRLGINVKDANGHMRTMADMMPEVIEKISKIEVPATRAAAANELLGASGDKLVESFRQSHKGAFEPYFRDAERYTALTDKQRAALQLFVEAQGRVSTAFDSLGQQISATLAKNFTPLLTHLSEFVEKHTPEIIAAVDRISTKFAAWLDGIEWENVEAGLQAVMNSFTWIINHLDEIKTAAEVVAVVFATKWAIGMVANIGLIVTAINPVTVALVAIGAALVLVISHWEDFGKIGSQVLEGIERTANRLKQTLSDFWSGKQRPEDMPKPGQVPGYPTQNFTPGGAWAPKPSNNFTPGGAWAPPGSPATPGAAPQQLGQLPGDTSWGDYGTRANNPGNMNYASWQNASGRFSYTDPQTGGGHTMAVYNTMEEGVADTYKLLARNQEKHGKTLAGALHGWAENSYIPQLAKSAGVDPNAEFDISKADPQTVARMMSEQFRREGRRGSHTATQEQIVAGIDRARAPTAPPVAIAQGGAPAVPPPPGGRINGAVDVSITHRNPPPDSAVTAKGSGQVNVAPPRVEHQEFSSI